MASVLSAFLLCLLATSAYADFTVTSIQPVYGTEGTPVVVAISDATGATAADSFCVFNNDKEAAATISGNNLSCAVPAGLAAAALKVSVKTNVGTSTNDVDFLVQGITGVTPLVGLTGQVVSVTFNDVQGAKTEAVACKFGTESVSATLTDAILSCALPANMEAAAVSATLDGTNFATSTSTVTTVAVTGVSPGYGLLRLPVPVVVSLTALPADADVANTKCKWGDFGYTPATKIDTTAKTVTCMSVMKSNDNYGSTVQVEVSFDGVTNTQSAEHTFILQDFYSLSPAVAVLGQTQLTLMFNDLSGLSSPSCVFGTESTTGSINELTVTCPILAGLEDKDPLQLNVAFNPSDPLSIVVQPTFGFGRIKSISPTVGPASAAVVVDVTLSNIDPNMQLANGQCRFTKVKSSRDGSLNDIDVKAVNVDIANKKVSCPAPQFAVPADASTVQINLGSDFSVGETATYTLQGATAVSSAAPVGSSVQVTVNDMTGFTVGVSKCKFLNNLELTTDVTAINGHVVTCATPSASPSGEWSTFVAVSADGKLFDGFNSVAGVTLQAIQSLTPSSTIAGSSVVMNVALNDATGITTGTTACLINGEKYEATVTGKVLTCAVPALSMGSYAVEFCTQETVCSAQKTVNFIYQDITAVSPSTGEVESDVTVSMNDVTGMQYGVSKCKFGGTQTTLRNVDTVAKTVTCAAPTDPTPEPVVVTVSVDGTVFSPAGTSTFKAVYTPVDPPGDGGGNKTGLIVGVVIGVVAAVAIAVGAVYYLRKRRQSRVAYGGLVEPLRGY
eukprot:GILK01000918.1.p1 GENE.GILK01000918.1~~GILK01000918.1.p1  ORF type:complete len:802 (-),score=183.97 GILK01000918.1:278-2638(-)